ncbi:MAG: flagellar basal body rod protein FlgC [Limnochordales bacterium]|nr:flagellar basal body rod protein FlgC [Limnochordales bacterium]
MGLFDALAISGSGLTAQRLRMDVIADNLANAQTTRSENGGPYQRRIVVFQERNFAHLLANRLTPGGGVRVAAVTTDSAPPRLVYDPGHPDAGPDGYVRYPNINPVTEMVDMLVASRVYEANVVAMETTRQLALRTLELLRG